MTKGARVASGDDARHGRVSPAGTPRCTSSCASTGGRSIPYNGWDNGETRAVRARREGAAHATRQRAQPREALLMTSRTAPARACRFRAGPRLRPRRRLPRQSPGRARALTGTSGCSDDVFALIASNYVEDVEPGQVMHGAMRGLADGARRRQRLPDAVAGQAGRSGSSRCRRATCGIVADATVPTSASSRRATARRPRRRGSALATSSASSTASRRATCRSGRGCGAARRARLDGHADRHPRQRGRPARRRPRPRAAAGPGVTGRIAGRRRRLPAHRGLRRGRRPRWRRSGAADGRGAKGLLIDIRAGRRHLRAGLASRAPVRRQRHAGRAARRASGGRRAGQGGSGRRLGHPARRRPRGRRARRGRPSCSPPRWRATSAPSSSASRRSAASRRSSW